MKPASPLNTPPSTTTAPIDKDLAEQANPGQGIPSQDPRGAAQTLLEPHEAERESKSVLTGGGLVAGAVTGAAIGVAVAGPVGSLAGVMVGAVAGAVGGGAAGAAVSPEDLSNADTAPAGTAHPPIEDSGGNGRPAGRRRDV